MKDIAIFMDNALLLIFFSIGIIKYICYIIYYLLVINVLLFVSYSLIKYYSLILFHILRYKGLLIIADYFIYLPIDLYNIIAFIYSLTGNSIYILIMNPILLSIPLYFIIYLCYLLRI